MRTVIKHAKYVTIALGQKGEPMVDKELIENWRNMLKPSISSWLFKTNYEGMGEQDKEEFGRDFDEILDLALIGLKYKAQLSQEGTDKRTETHACDLISRQAAIDAIAGCTNCRTEEVLREYVAMHNLDNMWSGGILEALDAVKGLPSAQPSPQWIPCSERLPENRVSVIVCFREWQQYAKRYIYSIVIGWYARKHSVRENVFSEWEADCDYDEDEDEFCIQEGWYEFTTQGNADLMNWYINAEVVAWMPLPEPYEEGDAHG